MKRVLLATAAVCALWTGCGDAPLVAESTDIELSGWPSEEGATFHWNVEDTLQRHDMLLDVRHSQVYLYSNLYVFLTYRFPNGKSRIDTVECTLADDKGRWRGRGFGDLVDQRFMLNQGIQFPIKGRYGLEVRHGMRHDPLPDVANIGFRLERSQGVSSPE